MMSDRELALVKAAFKIRGGSAIGSPNWMEFEMALSAYEPKRKIYDIPPWGQFIAMHGLHTSGDGKVAFKLSDGLTIEREQFERIRNATGRETSLLFPNPLMDAGMTE